MPSRELTVDFEEVEVYDPTSAVRSNSAHDIACWFIDTAYDGESFFVRHAYFTGADEPYDKLKRHYGRRPTRGRGRACTAR